VVLEDFGSRPNGCTFTCVSICAMHVCVNAKFLSVKERRARNENSEPIRQAYKEESQKKFATIRLHIRNIEFSPLLFLMRLVKHAERCLADLNTSGNLVWRKCSVHCTALLKERNDRIIKRWLCVAYQHKCNLKKPPKLKKIRFNLLSSKVSVALNT